MLDERTSVRRRAFLALGAGTLLSGCVQGNAPGGRETVQPTEPPDELHSPAADGETKTAGTNRTETKPTTTDRVGKTFGIGSNKNEPQATATIGGTIGSEPPEDSILVWNNADTARRITVTVAEKEASGEPLFQETYRFKSDAYIEIGVSNPGEYVVSVAVGGDEPTNVDFTADDCNYQNLYITIMPNRGVRSSKVSTMKACATI